MFSQAEKAHTRLLHLPLECMGKPAEYGRYPNTPNRVVPIAIYMALTAVSYELDHEALGRRLKGSLF